MHKLFFETQRIPDVCCLYEDSSSMGARSSSHYFICLLSIKGMSFWIGDSRQFDQSQKKGTKNFLWRHNHSKFGADSDNTIFLDFGNVDLPKALVTTNIDGTHLTGRETIIWIFSRYSIIADSFYQGHLRPITTWYILNDIFFSDPIQLDIELMLI